METLIKEKEENIHIAFDLATPPIGRVLFKPISIPQNFKAETIPSVNRVRIFIKHHIWKWIISPLFLMFALLVYVCIPIQFFSKGLFSSLFYQLNRYTKRLLDIVGAIIGLALYSIPILIIGVLIKLDSKGPVLYTQLRVGKNRRKVSQRKIAVDIYSERRREDRRKYDLNGKTFIIYKFRTMRENAEKKCGPVWATENDPRITSVGKFLRATHLDELPQLINILKGDMSFVGPRPERPYFVTRLISMIPEYNARLKVKPGLTGLAQINCGYDQSIETVKYKLNYDLLYCQNGNLYSYFKIIFLTFHRMVLNRARA